MPERSKRKNKNKNKRKNKNVRVDNGNNGSEVIEKESEESCSVQLGNNEPVPELEENNKILVSGNNINEEVIVLNDVTSEHVCRDDISTSEDVNNNSSAVAVETLQVPIQHIGDIENQIIEEQECDNYLVESPEQSLKSKSKLNKTNKSKSLDNEDEPKIVDITEDVTTQSEDDSILAVVDTSNILVTDVDSDIEWEKTGDVEVPSLNDVATGTLSISTVPLNTAQCQHINISLSPDVESSLRGYLRTLDLSTHPESSVEIKAEIEQIINREIRHRLRKKGLAGDFGLQRLGPPRTLDVIDEEGSGESSKSSRRQSYLSDKKSDNEDLEDDVFEDKNKVQEKMARKTETTIHKKTFGRLLPQQCMLVDAKIKEPEVSEAGGNWTMKTLEKMTGAEVVYLTDSSSSTSSLHEYGDETDDGMDTDVSVRMITPTIEVTDADNFLKNSFIASEPSKPQCVQDNQRNEHVVSIEFEKENQNDVSTHDISAQNTHEIVVLSTDDIKTNLYVKDVEPESENSNSVGLPLEVSNISKEKNTTNDSDKYDLEMKVLKCELNDAINNLIKEVSDTEVNENTNQTFVRQDSSSSVCSSQCTAKYNPTSSSLNDVSNLSHDENPDNSQSNTDNNETTGSHVKDVFEYVTGAPSAAKDKLNIGTRGPSHLRDLCVRRIALFPYGDKILEELASVSKRIQNITKAFTLDNTASTVNDKKENSKQNVMPYYPLPDISPIEKLIIPTKTIESVPPPIQPRQSSLKKKSLEEDAWTGIPTKAEPVYVCLSPSQKMLMEKTKTIISTENASELADMHRKYVDRRGYNDHYTKETPADENSNEISPIIPFKSQTGSRLLALIKDPSVTNNIKLVDKHRSLDQLENKFTKSQTTSIKHHDRRDLSDINKTFRPIPPPKPKKLASSFYESDGSSDFTDSSMRSMKTERKFFHFSTGNLNKEIEDDISTIQNMHRYYTNARDNISGCPRRPSLPKDLCDQQMEYIRQKEKEVEAEIQRLESLRNIGPSSPQKTGPRAPLITESEINNEKFKDSNNYFISKRRDFFASLNEKLDKSNTNVVHNKEKGKLSSAFSSSQEELQREKMYSEYVTQMAQREERKQHKVIKITNTPVTASSKTSKSMPSINKVDTKVNNRIEKEFISKARERWDKLGIRDPETEDEKDDNTVYREPKVIEHKIKVIEGGQEKDMTNLPNHLQEFVRFTAKEKEHRTDSSGECKSEPASPHVMILCAVIIIVIAVGKYFLRLLRNK